MFDGLSKSLQSVFQKVSRTLNDTDDLSKANMKEPLKEIRRALLEADVSLPVVKSFLDDVEKRSRGVEVVSGVTPAQQLAKVVQDALTEALGGIPSPLTLPAGSPANPTVILLAGLQGAGKTTTAGKLARLLMSADKAAPGGGGRKVLLASADTFRPAAAEQLEILATQIGAAFMPQSAAGGASAGPAAIARKAVEEARRLGCDTVIVDTAGRSQADAALMQELQQVKSAVSPQEILLVMDAMTGQEAAGVASAFSEKLGGVTGCVLTKLDGDARGGAALSVRGAAKAPIKFVGVGEASDALEPFFPDRAASRILGMGDVVSLVERAARMNRSEVEKLGEKILKSEFDFDAFLQQAELMSGLGSMGQIAKMIPGMQGRITDEQISQAEKRLKVFKSIIQSMTKEERRNPQLVLSTESRAMRAAKGAGRTRDDVAALLMTYTQMKGQYEQLAKMAMGGGLPGMPGVMGGMGGLGGLAGGFGGAAAGLAGMMAGGGAGGMAGGMNMMQQAAAMQQGMRPKSKEELWREQQRAEKEKAKASRRFAAGAALAAGAAKKGFGGGGAAAPPAAAAPAKKGFGGGGGGAAVAAPAAAKKGGSSGGKKKK